MTTPTTAPIRVTDPAGIVATVSTMLGFHPENSAVMVCLSGERSKVGLVARVDFPTRPRDAAAMARQLTNHAVARADAVILLGYQVGGYPHPFLVDHLAVALGEAGVPIRSTLLATAAGIVDADDNDAPVIPSPTATEPTTAALSAASALIGRRTVGSRAEVAASVAGPHGVAELAMASNLAVARARSESRPTPAALAERGLAEVARGAVSIATAALFVAACEDVTTRDRFAARAVTETGEAWVPLLVAVVAATPDAYVADVAALLAVAAYRQGDGALAHVALDRTFTADRDHALGHLMLAVMAAGMSPETLARVIGAE